jgi:hypothetical protein
VSAAFESDIRHFADLAYQYCAFIERSLATAADNVLREAHWRLPDLYSAALRLPDVCTIRDDPEDAFADEEDAGDEPASTTAEKPDPGEMTNDEWMQLWRRLGKHLGDRKFYREVFAPYDLEEDAAVAGDLADDFADVYRDLRRGLAKWHAGDAAGAAWVWQFHFGVHWGEHAASAIRALHALAFDHDLRPAPRGMMPNER